MGVTGLDVVLGKLSAWGDKTESLMETRMTKLAMALQVWAKAEHAFTNRTGDLERSITAFIVESTPINIDVRLQATMEYSVFVELARGGKWSFLWPVLERHRSDIVKILGGAGGDEYGPMSRDPGIQSHYEQVKAQFRTLSAARRGAAIGGS